MNKNEPLGLPRGSVRALLALIVSIGSFAYFFIHSEFPVEILGVLTVVITYYYVSRTADNATNPATPVEDPLPEPYVGGNA